ncbi:unnamed protein product, partial [Closterium sp. NIES-54]
DIMFDESVSYYRLFPYRTASLPPPPLFLAPGTPPVDPLPPQGPAPSGVSQVDPVEPVQVAVDSGAARGAEPAGAGTGGVGPERVEPGGAELRGAESGSAEPGGAEPERAESGGPLGASGAGVAGGAAGAGAAGCAAGAGAAGGAARARAAGGTAGAGAAGAAGSGGIGAAGTGAIGAVGGAGAAGPEGARTGGTGAAGAGGALGFRAIGAGAVATSGATGPGAEGTGAVSAVSGGAARPRPYYVPLLQQVLGPPPPLLSPPPVQSQSLLQPTSPMPGPSPYSGPTRGLTERRDPESHHASPESHSESLVRDVRTGRRVPRQRPPLVPGTHSMTLRPSTAPQRVPLSSPPASSLPDGPDPESDSLRTTSPTVTRFLATAVTDPYLVAESASVSVCPPSVGGESALGTNVLEDRQEEFECFAAAVPHLVSMLLAPEGDPDAPDIPTPRSYAKAIEGTYVDEVPPPGANIVNGMWIFRVKWPPGSPRVFKARYVARGFRQRQGVDFFQTFSPTPKMTTLRVLLHVAAQRDYELHSLDFSTAFLQSSLHEEIWLRRPPGFTGSFPAGTQWSLRRPVYGLRQAPREWNDTLRTTLAALGFAPSTADPSLFLRTNTTLPPFYVLVAQRTITLTQSHMVQQVLQRFGFSYSSPQSTPLPTGHSLSAPPSDEPVEPNGPYPELVGCLIIAAKQPSRPTAEPPEPPSCRAASAARAARAAELPYSSTASTPTGVPRPYLLRLSWGSESWGSGSWGSESWGSESWGSGLWTSESWTSSWTQLSMELSELTQLDSVWTAPSWDSPLPQMAPSWTTLPYYRLFPYRTAPLPPPPLFLAPGPPPVDPLPPQGPAPSGVSQVDAIEPVEVAVDSGAAPGTEPAGVGSGGAETGGAEPGGAGTGGAEPGGAEPGGAETGGTEPGGAEPGGTEPGGAEPGGAGSARVASHGASSRREVLSPLELREWFARRWGRATGAGGTTAVSGFGGSCSGGAGPGGTAEAAGVGPTRGSAGASAGPSAAGSVGTGAVGATGVGAAGGVGAGGSADAGTSEGAGAGAAGAGGATDAGALAGSPGAVPAGFGGATRPRPYFVPLLEQVLGLPPSPGPAPPLECPQPVQSQSLFQPVSPLPAPSPYAGPTGGLAERRAPASRPASPARPACTSRRTSRPRPPAVPGTHQMTLHPSTAPLRVPLPSPPESSLPVLADPASDSLRAASPTVARFLATVVTDPSLASTAASALVAELVDFAARCRLDYAASLVAESASVCPPSVGGCVHCIVCSPLCSIACELALWPFACAQTAWFPTCTHLLASSVIHSFTILTRGTGAGGAGVGGQGVGGAGAGGAGDVVPGGAVRSRPYFVPQLQQVLGTPSSSDLTPPLLCPPLDQLQPQLQPASPLLAPSPYTEQSGGHIKRCEPASRRVSPVRTARRVPRSRRPPVPGMHAMTLRPPSVPLCVPLPAPPASSRPEVLDLESDCARAASPTVSRLLATAVPDPSFESAAASALVAELLDFAVACRLHYASALVAESESASPPSVEGECALGTDVMEDRQEDFESLAAAVPRFASMLLAHEVDLDAPDIPTPRSYAVAITGPYSSQWQAAMDAEMASWKSTGTYVDEVPPPGANIVDGMWIFRVKWPPGSPLAFKARYVARGLGQRQGVHYFQTFSPTPKMTTLRVLLHVAAQRDYELHSLDFSIAFLQGSLHEEIWLRRPPGFTESFPAGTQWSLRRPVYGLRQAPREWHDTLRTTLAALGFAPSTADSSLFLRTDTSLPPFYVFVYVDDLVFATADTEALTLVKSELQKRHTCPDLAPPSDESVEPSGPYPELVGCPMYLMTCTRPDLAYPLSLLARYVAPGRHRKVHWDAANRVLRYLCCRSGMGLVLGGRGPAVLTGHADASWIDDSATQWSSQGYTFSLCSSSVSWHSTRSSSVLSSSCEAEIYAGAMAAQELRWLTYLLTDLGEQPRSPPVLHVDNKAMIALCQEHRLEHRTNHIALRYFLARELQQRGQLRLAYMATRANTADVFTKALPPGDHQRFVIVLGVVPTLPHLLTT